MTDEERIARLTALARKMACDADAEAEACDVLVHLDRFANGVTSAWMTGCRYGRIEVWHHPRALDALEVALCVLANEPPYLDVALRDAMDRVRELLADRAQAYDRLNEVKALVCDVGQSDERIDALRLLLVGRCYVCGEPAAVTRAGILLCYAHHASEGA